MSGNLLSSDVVLERQMRSEELGDLAWLTEARARLRKAREGVSTAADACFDYSRYGVVGGSTVSHDFDSLVRRSTTIVIGTVLASGDGVAGGSPQTLLLVDVDRWMKRADAAPPTEQVYIRYESPEISIGDVAVCRPHNGLPPAPSRGTRVLLITYGAPSDWSGGVPVLYAGERLIYDGVAEGLVTLMASDRVLNDSPAWLVNATVASLEQRIAKLLGFEVGR